MLPEKHVEDDTVNRVVPAIESEHADFSSPLAETIYAPLALFVPGRVPAQVVVNDGIEIVLQIDAFGKAVGANQDVLR